MGSNWNASLELKIPIWYWDECDILNLQNSRGVLCIRNKSNPNCFSWWIHHLKANNNLIETSIMCSLWVSLVLRDEIHNSNLTTVINFFKYDMNAASVGYNRWNTSLPSGSWLPVKDVSTSLGLLWKPMSPSSSASIFHYASILWPSAPPGSWFCLLCSLCVL